MYFAKDWCSIIVDSMLMKTCTAAYSSRDAAVGKQRQMWSSILLSPPISLTKFLLLFPVSPVSPDLCFSLSLFLSLFLLGGQVTNKHQNFCLSDTIPARIPGAQVQSGSVYICMEIGYSLGIHRGHTTTTAAHIRTYWDSAGGGDVCVYIYAEREGKSVKKKKQ